MLHLMYIQYGIMCGSSFFVFVLFVFVVCIFVFCVRGGSPGTSVARFGSPKHIPKGGFEHEDLDLQDSS